MSRYVIDASVALKWFVPEILSEAAVHWLDGENELLVPDLLLVEFTNILWKKARLNELREREARKIVQALPAMPWQVHAAAPFLQAAFEIAWRLQRSVYDSLYLALAVAHECCLVTADKKFYRAVEASPLARYILWVENK